MYFLDGGLYLPSGIDRQKNANPQKPDTKAASFRDVEVRRDWWVFAITTFIALATYGIVCAYTYYSARQVAVSQGALDAARSATRYSDRALGRTLDKMQGQIDATNKLYGEAQKQTNSASDEVTQAKLALAQSKDQFIQDERPLLWMEEPRPPSSSALIVHSIDQFTESFHTTLWIKNVGKSPALSVHSCGYIGTKLHYPRTILIGVLVRITQAMGYTRPAEDFP